MSSMTVKMRAILLAWLGLLLLHLRANGNNVSRGVLKIEGAPTAHKQTSSEKHRGLTYTILLPSFL